MSSFDEDVVREYFELNHFYVRQLQKYQVRSGKRASTDAICMQVLNPAVAKESASINFQLFSVDMSTVRQAIVIVHSWDQTRVTPAILKNNSRLSDFLKKEVLKQLKGLGTLDVESDERTEGIRRIAVIPGFPTVDPYRTECAVLFKEQGIDGVITFSTILEDWLRHLMSLFHR